MTYCSVIVYQLDSYNVEAALPGWVVFLQVILRNFTEVLLFSGRNGFFGGSKFSGPPGFDLNERQYVISGCYKITFPEGGLVVSNFDIPIIILEEGCRKIFSPLPKATTHGRYP